MLQEIDIQGLPDGWRAIAYRIPKRNDYFFGSDGIHFATRDFGFDDHRLIIERIYRRVTLEMIGENRIPKQGEWYTSNGHFFVCKSSEGLDIHEIWHEIIPEHEES